MPILPTHQGNQKHHIVLALKGLPHLISVPNKYFQLYSPTTYRGIISYQTAAHKYYLLDIFTNNILYINKGIAESTATRQYVKWGIRCTLLLHTGIKNKLLEEIPQGDKTTLGSSFVASVQRNQFDTTNKSKLLHGTVKDVVLDVHAPLRTDPWCGPNLDASGKNTLY